MIRIIHFFTILLLVLIGGCAQNTSSKQSDKNIFLSKECTIVIPGRFLASDAKGSYFSQTFILEDNTILYNHIDDVDIFEKIKSVKHEIIDIYQKSYKTLKELKKTLNTNTMKIIEERKIMSFDVLKIKATVPGNDPIYFYIAYSKGFTLFLDIDINEIKYVMSKCN